MYKLKKALIVIQRKLIGLINYVSPDKYMAFYVRYLLKIGVNLKGIPSYIYPSAYLDGIDYSLICIGNESVISKDVMLLTHDYSGIRALNAVGHRGEGKRILSGITIGSNTFIGARSVILPGSTIGNNVIVGAGSIVKGWIPDGVVIVGNPAKIIETTEEYAAKLIQRESWSRSKTYE